jgi:hypothetical protein
MGMFMTPMVPTGLVCGVALQMWSPRSSGSVLGKQPRCPQPTVPPALGTFNFDHGVGCNRGA